MNLSLTKNELRTIYKAKRMALSQDEVIFLSQKLLENFILQFNIIDNQKVNVFLSISKFNEVETGVFIDYFFEHNVRVFVPKIVDGKMVSIEIFRDSAFEINAWGIREPISNNEANTDYDYVLTPLLYCDRFGNRVGYGKGFYDSFFAENPGVVKKVGLNFFEPLEDVADFYDGDIKLDVLLTPDKLFVFR